MLPQPDQKDENPGLGPLFFLFVVVAGLLLLVLINLPSVA